MIRDVHIEDAHDIAAIYNYYIKNTTITFEELEIDAEEISNRIKSVTENFPWIVYEVDGRVVGYAYVSPFKSRSAYKNSVESSIYIDHEFRGRGVGTLLYKEIIRMCVFRNYHTILGITTYPNDKSVLLHQKFGFEKVAHYKEVGYKFNTWIDVAVWQLLLS